MMDLVEQFKALDLPKAVSDDLKQALGTLNVVMHRLGSTPGDNAMLMSLILDFVTEVRDR